MSEICPRIWTTYTYRETGRLQKTEKRRRRILKKTLAISIGPRRRSSAGCACRGSTSGRHDEPARRQGGLQPPGGQGEVSRLSVGSMVVSDGPSATVQGDDTGKPRLGVCKCSVRSGVATGTGHVAVHRVAPPRMTVMLRGRGTPEPPSTPHLVFINSSFYLSGNDHELLHVYSCCSSGARVGIYYIYLKFVRPDDTRRSLVFVLHKVESY